MKEGVEERVDGTNAIATVFCTISANIIIILVLLVAFATAYAMCIDEWKCAGLGVIVDVLLICLYAMLLEEAKRAIMPQLMIDIEEEALA